MFYGRMVEYSLESPREVTDSYNHTHHSWRDEGKTRAYIILQDTTGQTANDLSLSSTSLVGYTQDMRIQKGWRIDGRYVVESVVPHRADKVLYLQEVTNG